MEPPAKDAPDRISNLPECVISCIMSKLTLKEAAATSVLSSRWKSLWTCLPRMIFDNEEDFPDMFGDTFEEMVEYVVNHYSGGSTLDEFSLHFVPDEDSKSRIDHWLDFALSAGATRVQLELRSGLLAHYPVPAELFCLSKRTGLHSTPRSRWDRFVSLRELFLSYAYVSDGVFAGILSTCVSLETLVVEKDRLLRTAKCTIPRVKLKHLTVESRSLRHLEIVAPNLIVFHCLGPVAVLSIQGAQHLVDLLILTRFEQNDVLSGPLSAYTPQLRCLTLDTGRVLEIIARGRIPTFRNLRTMSLVNHYYGSTDTVSSCHRAALCLLEAAPLLQRFELHYEYDIQYYFGEETQGLDELEKILKSKHQNLKEIMMSGFRCSKQELQFLRFIVGRSTSLECVELLSGLSEYCVDWRGFYNWWIYSVDHFCYRNDIEEKFGSSLPPNVRLKILDFDDDDDFYGADGN